MKPYLAACSVGLLLMLYGGLIGSDLNSTGKILVMILTGYMSVVVYLLAVVFARAK